MSFALPTLLFLSVLLAGVFVQTSEAKDSCFTDRNSCLASKCKICVQERRPKSVLCQWKCSDSNIVKKLAKGVIAAIVISIIVFIAIIVCICACLCCPFCLLAKCLSDRKNKDNVERGGSTTVSYATPTSAPGGQINHGYPAAQQGPPPVPGDRPEGGGMYPAAY